MKRVILLSLSILLISLGHSFAEVPCKINYQGRLIKNNVPVDGTKTMKFSIHDSAVGPTLLWTSGNVSVEVHNGLFRYVIGSGGTDLSGMDWTAGQTLYLEVVIDGETLTPREELSAYPYAINSHLLEGKAKEYFLDTSGDAQTKQGNLNIIGNVGIGTTSPTHKLDVRGALRIDPGSSYDVWIQGGSATSGTSRNLAILGIKSSDELRLNFGGEYTGGVRIQGSKTMIDGNLGIGTTSPSEDLHVYRGDSDVARIYATGGSQGAGMIYVGQSPVYGGGITYDGDGNPDIVGGSDRITFFRRAAGTDAEVFSYSYGNSNVGFAGNVGIGTTSPGEKLTVAGTIESTTGGVKFPDGTLQTTAGVRTYVSEWKSITPQGKVTFDHNLGTDKLIVTIQVKVGGVIHQQHHADYGGWGLGVEAYEISTTQIKVSAGNYIRFFTSTGQMSNVSSADIRVLAIKMD